MKLINQVKKHGKVVTLHLKRHHKKYIFGILSVSLLVKGFSLLVAHTLVHNLSFANTDTGDNNDSIITTGFDNNELSGDLDEFIDGLGNANNMGNSDEGLEDTTESEEQIDFEDPEKPGNFTELEEPTDSEDSERPENSTEPEEPTDSENQERSENPIEPEEPTDSENPERLENSTEPEEPTNSENPEIPVKLTEPEEPIGSENSEEPTKSEGSTVSENLVEQEELENSTEFEGPIVPEDSDNSVMARWLGDSEDTLEEDYYFDVEIMDDEEYLEEFEDVGEKSGEENDGNMVQEIYVNTKSNMYGLTTFEKAFQEVAYAYYMRGPYIHYNVSKGYGDVNAEAPEEATSQDYNYLGCGLFVMNVYKELLNIKFYQFSRKYAETYFGERPEVIGYGIKKNGKLNWYDKDHDKQHPLENPDKNYIISLLQIGDILHYYGHEMLVYDLIYDDSGNVVDVYLIHTNGGGYMTKSKTHGDKKIYNISGNTVSIGIGHAPWANLFYNNMDNTGLYTGSRIEGVIKLQKFSEKGGTALLFDNNINHYANDYVILRFVTNTGGKDLLSIDGTYKYYTGEEINNEEIGMDYYSDRVKSRLKYSRLYIEKIVDKRDNNIVQPNEELTYTIKIQNNSDKVYDDDLIVKENMDTNLVQNLSRYSYTKNGVPTNDIELISNNGNQLQWNIGKLNNGDEMTLKYTVKVKTGNMGETIESIGMVDDIPSGTIKNKIGRNLKEQDSNLISEKYNDLKTQYTGKTLINEIYKGAYNVDLGLDNLNLKTNIIGGNGLIYFNNKWGNWSNRNDSTYLYINKENAFSGMVLNSYFNALYKNSIIRSYNSSGNEIKVQIYALPSLSLKENDPDGRATTIVPTDFKTGDILIYINENDILYSTGKNIIVTGENGNVLYSGPSIKETYITYENGEYAYIYIGGKFVGVNLGNDLMETKDDRNEFTLGYYTKNNLSGFKKDAYITSLKTGLGKINMPDGGEEWLQYQSLFGKDAYVILRPSLIIRNITYELNGGTGNDENPSVFILGSDVELEEPTRDGFTFQGWYTDSEYTIPVNSTNELTDDVVLYAKWENSTSNSHELTTFQKAFQEVAYAYYMRGPYIHYNSAKGRGHDFSPEEATSQDYNYLACGLYVLNVYRELLGNIITFPPHGGQDAYAKKYVGKRPEVIGYGEKSGGNLLWWDSTTPYLGESKMINPTKNDIIKQLQIGDIFGYEGHVTMVYDYKYNESGDIEDVYLIHATDSPQYRVYSKMNLGVTVYDKSGTGYELSIGHNKWSAIRYNNFNRTAQSEHHPDARIEGTVQLNTMSKINQKLEFNTGNYLSHYYILRFVTDDGSGNSILSINGTNLAGYRECSTCSYTYYSGQVNYSDSIQSRLKYNKLYIEKTVNKRNNTIVGVGDELTYTIRIQNNSDQAYDDDLIIKENINTDLVENLSLYSYEKNGTQIQEIQLLNDGNQLQWNIGKLNSGDEVIIQYIVKVRPGNIGETIESTGMAGGIPSGIVTNTIGRNTDKGENLKIAYNDLRNDFTGKFLINEIYREVYGINLGIDKITEINTEDELDTGALIYYNNKWGNRGTSYDDVEMKINRKSPYSGMILNSYFNVLYKNINDAHAVNKSGDEIIITRYGFPAIASNDVDKRADTIFPGNFQTGDILIYKNSNDLYYNWKTSPGYAYVSHTNTYENGEYVYIYMDGKFVGMNLGNDLTGARDDRNEFTTNYYSNAGIDSRYYTDSGVGVPQNIPGGFNNWLHYQTLFGKDAYVILRPSLVIRNITYELDGGTNNGENPNAFIIGRDVELKEPTKTGYVFSGWYTDSGYTIPVSNTNELTDDVVLYANWESNTCTFNGAMVNHGESVTGYASSTVPYGSTCESETRTCVNGKLSGTYQYGSCTIQQPGSCIFNGSVINHGESITGYASEIVPYGSTCESEIRTCVNGELSGTYQYGSCMVQSNGGGGGASLRKDKCPNGDFSDSYYDGICEKDINNEHNAHNVHNAPNIDTGNSYQRGEGLEYDTLKYNPKYSDEMNQAYQYSYYYGITTKETIKDADVNGKLTRIAMAKMLSQYAINVLGKEPDKTKQNTFVDVSSKLDSDYSSGVTLAYQLGIMGINMKDNKFRPYDTVSRAEFVTALSRLLYGIEDGKDKYYSTHMNLLKYLGIITNTNPTMKELRGYVMLMIMRSEKIKNN